MIDLSEFKKAKKILDDNNVLNSTKLINMPFFSKKVENNIYVKPENLQKIGAYKIRGAFNFIYNLTEEQKKKGVIAASAGNHAQGVALSAKMLGIKAVIVMPKGTPLIKVENVKKYGAEVVLEGNIYDEAYAKAMELQKEYGYVFAHPFNDDKVITGQGTIGLEILEDLPNTDIILVPVGGGGLISGISMAVKQINSKIKVIGVEPTNAPSMKEALKNNKLVTIKNVKTIADGTAVATIGDKTFEYAKKYVDDIILIDDEELTDSFITLLNETKLVAEPSGLLSLAATKKLKYKDQNVVSIISGGNIDLIMMSTFLKKGLVINNRILNFSLILQNKVGELLKVAEVLSELGANVIELRHNQFNNFPVFTEVELGITVETKNKDHIDSIISKFKELNYEIKINN